MGTFRPHWQPQGPDSRCIYHGQQLGWENCTPTSSAMLVERATLGKQRPTGCAVRQGVEPDDYIGGTTINQCAQSLSAHWGVHLETHVGSGVVRTSYAARQIRAGRPALIQGNAAAMLDSDFQSTAGAVNHCVFVNEVQGGTLDEPASALVYDPAADGHKPGYDQGPSWWPWWMVKRFGAALQPNYPASKAVLGSGWFYCAFGPDTEPHVILRPGAVKSKPFPDRTRAKYTGVVIHSSPSGPATGKLAEGQLFTAYQYFTHPTTKRVWLGDQDNRQWVLAMRLNHVGGTT